MCDRYPKTPRLENATIVTIRPLVRDGIEGLPPSVEALAEEDGFSLCKDVSDLELMRRRTKRATARLIPAAACQANNLIERSCAHFMPYEWTKQVDACHGR